MGEGRKPFPFFLIVLHTQYMDNQSTNINNKVIENNVIALLKSINIDEKVMQEVLMQTNMEDRMLRHLIANADVNHLYDVILQERPEDCIIFDNLLWGKR